MQFNDWLTKNGFEPDKVTAAQRVALEAAWKAENASPPPVPTPTPAPAKPAGSRSLNDTLNAQRIREQHEERIESNLRAALDGRRITANDAVEIQIEAFADPDKWDDNRLELEFIRRERPKGPGIMVSREPQLNEKVIECAVSLCASLTNVERHYDEQTIDAARKRWPRGLTMVDMAATVARKNGYRGDTFKNNIKEVLRAAVQPDIRAGHAGPSTYSIPNILSNVAGKAALEGFYATEMVWSSVASRRSVTDFKQITSLRPTGDLIYQRLAPGGEIEHGSVGERAYTNQAHTYARMIGISREDWINDDTGALGGTSREMGVGAGDAVNDRFWTVFMNNTGSFFVAGNNNVSTGVFSLANLGEAQRVFKLQTKPNGRPLGLEPAILLVPVALEVAALNAINSTIVVATNTGTATTLTPNGNVLANKYQVLASAYLSNTSYTGNSAVAYYILAAPSRLSVIEGVFLNGVETPTVETADFDWNMLGTSMRGYLDFGFALQEFRAGVRSTGA